MTPGPAQRLLSSPLMSSLRIHRLKGTRALSSAIVSPSNRFFWRDANLPIEEASTPPTSWYTDPLFLEQVEKKHTFKTWMNVGQTHQLKEEGDYCAVTVMDQPLLLTRSKGEIRAFYNVCRHHAAQIVDSNTSGRLCMEKGERFSCPYHGWEYTADGRLAKAVSMKGCKNFSARDFGLRALPVDVLGPWIYVNLGGGEGKLTDQPDVRLISDMLEESRYRDLRYVKSATYHFNCNWKVYIDNYLDGGYHVGVAHPKLAKELNLDAYKRYPTQGHDFYLQTCPSSGTASSTNRVEGEALYIYQYPNVCINRYGQWMDINIVYPTGPSSTAVQFHWYADGALLDCSTAGSIEQSLKDSEQVQVEDMELCERVQRGLVSDGYEVGRYAPSLEGKYSSSSDSSSCCCDAIPSV
jgi:choline monooxygenase